MGNRKYHSREWLKARYIDEGRSTREIAELAYTDSGTISRWLRRLEIPTRPNGRHRTTQMAVRTKTETTAHEYVQHREPDGSVVKVSIHRLAAVAWFGYDEVVGNVVHHKDQEGRGRGGIPWDNREECLEVMSREDHGKHHAETQEWMSGSLYEWIESEEGVI